MGAEQDRNKGEKVKISPALLYGSNRAFKVGNINSVFGKILTEMRTNLVFGNDIETDIVVENRTRCNLEKCDSKLKGKVRVCQKKRQNSLFKETNKQQCSLFLK